MRRGLGENLSAIFLVLSILMIARNSRVPPVVGAAHLVPHMNVARSSAVGLCIAAIIGFPTRPLDRRHRTLRGAKIVVGVKGISLCGYRGQPAAHHALRQGWATPDESPT